MEEVDGACNAFEQAERSVRNVLLRPDQLCEPLSILGSAVQPQVVLSHLAEINIRLGAGARIDSPDRDGGEHSRYRPLHDKGQDLS